MLTRTTVIACALVALVGPAAPAPQRAVRALTGATLIDGTGRAPIPDAIVVIDGARIAAAGPASSVRVPDGAERIDVRGRFVIPGIINAHGHAAATIGLENRADAYTEENLLRQLGLYASYGVTTVVSLGDDGEAGFRLRAGNDSPALTRSRLYVAGPVITGKTPDEARAAVDRVARRDPDWIKIRVDDNLGTTAKMTPDVYRAAIDRAHEHQLRVAAHIFYLEDAKGLLKAAWTTWPTASATRRSTAS
jgi:imidazolonepropionase-like amidohydrolase